MKFKVNLGQLGILLILSLLQNGNARTLGSTSEVLSSTESIKINLIKEQQSPTVGKLENPRINDTAVETLPTQKESQKLSQSTSRNVLTHILRKKREGTDMPFEFHTTHLPCDLDQNGRAAIIDSFPNHCIWVYNGRYANEGRYRVYKTYQLEAFFFGQYYERLKRFEIDPHTWDYSGTGV